MIRRGAALLAAGLLLAACGSGGSGDPRAASGPTLTVFAAASLTSTFTALGRTFEAGHPGVEVAFSFAGSSDLVTQLQAGAPADVFASADAANMAKATGADLVAGKPAVFASNTLTIAVPPGNPAGITVFADLTRPGTTLVVCAPQVPCGAATEKVAAAAGVSLQPVSEESSVTDVLNKVVSGEADAGIVYVTDARGSGGKVAAVDFPEAQQAVNSYPIATLAASRQPDLARQFVDLVTGPQGRQVLSAAGFDAPRP